MIVLTPRQLEILARLASAGHPTNAVVAEQMGLSEQTIRNHLSQTFSRLGVGSVAGAWLALGWLAAPTPEEARAMGVDRRFSDAVLR